MNQKFLGQFKFTFKDNYDFNFCIIINVIYLSGKPILQIINFLTSFQAAHFLKDMSAKNI